jgi:hypothetical protein
MRKKKDPALGAAGTPRANLNTHTTDEFCDNPRGRRSQALDVAVDEPVDVVFTGIPPGRCGMCRRDLDPVEPVYFGFNSGFPRRVGQCCRPVLDRVILREVRRPS